MTGIEQNTEHRTHSNKARLTDIFKAVEALDCGTLNDADSPACEGTVLCLLFNI